MVKAVGTYTRTKTFKETLKDIKDKIALKKYIREHKNEGVVNYDLNTYTVSYSVPPTPDKKGNVIITTTPSPTPKKSGGGGGSSGGGSSNNQGVTSVVPVPSQVSSSQGTVEVYKPKTGIANAYNYWKYNRQNQTPLNTLKGTYQIATGRLRDNIQTRKDRRLAGYVESAEGRFEVSKEDKLRAAKGYSGTSQEFRYNKISEEILIRDAKLGDEAAAIALANRYNSFLEKTAEVIAHNLLNEDKNKMKSVANDLQNQVNKGYISVDKANEILSKYATELDTNRADELKKEINPIVKEKQDKLDKIVKTGRISRVIVTTAASVVAGVAIAPIAAASPRIVQAGGLIAGGVGMYGPVKRVTSGVIAGTATGLDVAEVVAPTAGFIAGSAIGIKIFGIKGKSVNPKLNVALETAELKPISVRAITTEQQIRILKIPEYQKLELLKQLNAGESVGVRTWRLKAKTPELQNILNKELPNYEIVSTGRSATLNNIYESNSIVRVSIGEGKQKFIDFTSGKTVGIYDVNSKKLYSQTVSVQQEMNKLPREIAKTTQVSKIDVKTIFENQELRRTVNTKTYSFEGEKRIAEKGKPITYNDLMEVATSEKVGKYPKSYSEIKELQKIVNAKEMNAKISVGEEDLIGFNLRELKFHTEKIKGSINKMEKPIEFEKTFSKKMKPFNYKNIIPEKINTEIPKPSIQQKQINKLQELNLGEVPVGINIENIKQSIKKGTKINAELLEPQRNKQVFSANKFELTQEQNKILSNNVINSNLNFDELTKQKTNQVNKQQNKKRSRNKIESNILTPVQVEKLFQQPSVKQIQMPRTKQPPKQVTAQLQTFNLYNPMKTPNINVPAYPPVFNRNKNVNINKTYNQLTKKQKQPSSKYTASLLSASFPTKPMKVTRKQLRKLDKVIWSGAEVRPTLELSEEQKEIKKEIEKVNF